MSDDELNYHGDDVLAQLLGDSDSAFDVPAIRDFVRGVHGAPEGVDPEAWIELVAPAPSAALKSQLKALAEEVAVHVREVVDLPFGDRLPALRAQLARLELQGFVVPRSDEHQNEFVPARAERLVWLTGFTGSAGLAIVLQDKAAIFVDGRYTLQVRNQVDTQFIESRHLTEEPPGDWIAENLGAGAKLGYDPWLHSLREFERLRDGCSRAGGELVASPDNPVDVIWQTQPAPPLAPVLVHPLQFAGRGSPEKRKELARGLGQRELDAAVLTAPDSIAWLLNIRGGDVPHTPLALSFAILKSDGTVELFIDRRKLGPEVYAHLGNAVRVDPPEAFEAALDRFGAAAARVLADPATAAAHIIERLEHAGATVVRGEDPCVLPKACKNPIELDGTRAAHRRDGAALTRFLAWLGDEAAQGSITEMAAVARLAELRGAGENFRDLSFDTISGAGANGAIVHYRVTSESDAPLEVGTLYLVDSGAQYLDGTTDVTRTVFIGPEDRHPTPEQRECFTRVLKGHIAVAVARFPEGTTGSQLDTLARHALWQAGLDYDHGTGHGVGSYLGVHEGPQRISKVPNSVELRPGMIVSNEPGYYKAGAYGIRIENLVAVIDSPAPDGAEKDLLAFETLTYAPIDLRLVEPDLLTTAEVTWLDEYHARVREMHEPVLDAATAAWLAQATRPLAG